MPKNKKRPQQLWTDSDEFWRNSFLVHNHRIILWSDNDESRESISLLPRLFAREGPLIAKNLTFKIDESICREWPREGVSLYDFLDKYGMWFSTLDVATFDDEDDEGDLKNYPISSKKIEQIRKASRISSVIIKSPDLTPFIPLIREPHVRHVKLSWTQISESEIALLRDHHWDDLTFHNCIFSINALQILREHPLPNLKIIQIMSYASVDMLPEFPCLRELSIKELDESVDRNMIFSTVARLTDLRKLFLPYYTREHEIDALITLTNLTSLDILFGHRFGDQTMTVLTRLSKLQLLNIGYDMKMTPARCELLIRGCTLLEELTWMYDGICEGDPESDASTIELFEMITTLSQLKNLQVISLHLTSSMTRENTRAFLSQQLHQLTSSTLRDITIFSISPCYMGNLLVERNQMLLRECHRYLYTVFILIRTWNQRVGSLVVLPKDVINLILTEHTPILGRRPSAIHEMVKFVWTNWILIEQLIHAKTIFKVVQSRSNEVRLVGLSQEQRWEIIL